ncbi:DUF3303 family protein [Streptomyces sp. TR06-5]|uniref:DUF3303 family protein n=1 Tax=unclassified Streptomyces TaxID=2593676 RepID=UPI0039A0FDE5
MRMLLKARMDTEHANRAVQSGAMEKSLMAVLDDLEPEAAYFVAEEGKRCALIVFDMQDASELPKVAEPFFSEFDAEVFVQPAMTPEDVRTGLAAWAGTR